MPRAIHPFRMLPKLQTAQAKPTPNHIRAQQKGPSLYNAKRLILTSRGTRDPKILGNVLRDPYDESWRPHVSADVAQFVDDMEAQGTRMLPSEKVRLISNPAHYFSRPQNVPNSLRQQVYFPTGKVVLRRTTNTSSHYAKFDVPMTFSKLDLKAYLKDIYNVDVVHIRSYVTYGKISRKTPRNPYTRGPVFRKASRKQMTVQLVEAFTWPKKPSEIDRAEFGADEFYRIVKAQEEDGKKHSNYYGDYLDQKHRKSIAEQARDLVQGKMRWSPTWEELPHNKRLFASESMANPTPTSKALPEGRVHR